MDYKDLYYYLFAAMSDAIEALKKRNYGDAEEILITATQEAEESFVMQRVPKYLPPFPRKFDD